MDIVLVSGVSSPRSLSFVNVVAVTVRSNPGLSWALSRGSCSSTPGVFGNDSSIRGGIEDPMLLKLSPGLEIEERRLVLFSILFKMNDCSGDPPDDLLSISYLFILHRSSED